MEGVLRGRIMWDKSNNDIEGRIGFAKVWSMTQVQLHAIDDDVGDFNITFFEDDTRSIAMLSKMWYEIPPFYISINLRWLTFYAHKAFHNDVHPGSDVNNVHCCSAIVGGRLDRARSSLKSLIKANAVLTLQPDLLCLPCTVRRYFASGTGRAFWLSLLSPLFDTIAIDNDHIPEAVLQHHVYGNRQKDNRGFTKIRGEANWIC
jgi:hypothetical protein